MVLAVSRLRLCTSWLTMHGESKLSLHAIAGSWLWTRLLSIILHPCKECSKLQANFASVHCVQR